jgi:hypothetical protein
MNGNQPPRIAKWLLSHFGCSPNNDAVIGDLDERYRQGHSRLWYWTQVFKGIMISLAQELGSHKLVALTAVITGWILLLVGMLLFRAVVASLNTLVRSNQPGNLGFLRETLMFHRNISLAVLIGISCIGWTCIGWILQRLYRPNDKAMVLTFVITVVAALISVTLAVSIQQPIVSSPHPQWASITYGLVGICGNTLGLICLIMGAGLLRDTRSQFARH